MSTEAIRSTPPPSPGSFTATSSPVTKSSPVAKSSQVSKSKSTSSEETKSKSEEIFETLPWYVRAHITLRSFWYRHWPEIAVALVAIFCGVALGLGFGYAAFKLPTFNCTVTKVEPWSKWSPCSPCGIHGTKSRKRTVEQSGDIDCLQSFQRIHCNAGSCCYKDTARMFKVEEQPSVSHCFTIQPFVRDWNSARGLSAEMGGDLAVIRNKEQEKIILQSAKALYARLKNGESVIDEPKFWLGLRCGISWALGDCLWVDGQSITLTRFRNPWRMGENETKCAYLDLSDNKPFWDLTDCNTLLPFVTQVYGTKHEICLSKKINNFCYRMEIIRKSWDEAANQTDKIQTTLVTIHTLKEQMHIKKEILSKASTTIDKIWIGLKCNQSITEPCRWIDNTGLTYSNWALNEPKQNKNENEIMCAVMDRHGEWYLRVCNEHHYFILEEIPDCDKIGYTSWSDWSSCVANESKGHRSRIIGTTFSGKEGCPQKVERKPKQEKCKKYFGANCKNSKTYSVCYETDEIRSNIDDHDDYPVVISTKKEQEFIRYLMETLKWNNKDYYIGIKCYRDKDVSSCRWRSNLKDRWKLYYDNFAVGHPRVWSNSSSCVIINGTDLLWYSVNCTDSYYKYYIKEINPFCTKYVKLMAPVTYEGDKCDTNWIQTERPTKFRNCPNVVPIKESFCRKKAGVSTTVVPPKTTTTKANVGIVNCFQCKSSYIFDPFNGALEDEIEDACFGDPHLNEIPTVSCHSSCFQLRIYMAGKKTVEIERIFEKINYNSTSLQCNETRIKRNNADLIRISLIRGCWDSYPNKENSVTKNGLPCVKYGLDKDSTIGFLTVETCKENNCNKECFAKQCKSTHSCYDCTTTNSYGEEEGDTCLKNSNYFNVSTQLCTSRCVEWKMTFLTQFNLSPNEVYEQIRNATPISCNEISPVQRDGKNVIHTFVRGCADNLFPFGFSRLSDYSQCILYPLFAGWTEIRFCDKNKCNNKCYINNEKCGKITCRQIRNVSFAYCYKQVDKPKTFYEIGTTTDPAFIFERSTIEIRDLATIQTLEEQEYILQNILPKQVPKICEDASGGYLIDLNCTSKNHCVWTNLEKQPIAEFIPFEVGEPNVNVGNCVALRIKSQKWFSVPCNVSSCYLLEFGIQCNKLDKTWENDGLVCVHMGKDSDNNEKSSCVTCGLQLKKRFYYFKCKGANNNFSVDFKSECCGDDLITSKLSIWCLNVSSVKAAHYVHSCESNSTSLAPIEWLVHQKLTLTEDVWTAGVCESSTECYWYRECRDNHTFEFSVNETGWWEGGEMGKLTTRKCVALNNVTREYYLDDCSNEKLLLYARPKSYEAVKKTSANTNDRFFRSEKFLLPQYIREPFNCSYLQYGRDRKEWQWNELVHGFKYCYQIEKKSSTWDDAIIETVSDNTKQSFYPQYLVKIGSPEEQDYVLSLLDRDTRLHWIGLRCRAIENRIRCIWQDGSRLDYQYFQAFQWNWTELTKQDHCVVIDPNLNGLWRPVKCSEKHPYILERLPSCNKFDPWLIVGLPGFGFQKPWEATGQNSVSVTVGNVNCPFVRYKTKQLWNNTKKDCNSLLENANYCYFAGEDNRPLEERKKNPMTFEWFEAFGRDLVTIKNIEEQNAMLEALSISSGEYLIGLRCSSNDIKDCKWIDGSPLDVNLFQSGSPDDRNHCVLLDAEMKKWKSHDCHSGIEKYILEYAPSCDKTTYNKFSVHHFCPACIDSDCNGCKCGWNITMPFGCPNVPKPASLSFKKCCNKNESRHFPKECFEFMAVNKTWNDWSTTKIEPDGRLLIYHKYYQFISAVHATRDAYDTKVLSAAMCFNINSNVSCFWPDGTTVKSSSLGKSNFGLLNVPAEQRSPYTTNRGNKTFFDVQLAQNDVEYPMFSSYPRHNELKLGYFLTSEIY